MAGAGVVIALLVMAVVGDRNDDAASGESTSAPATSTTSEESTTTSTTMVETTTTVPPVGEWGWSARTAVEAGFGGGAGVPAVLSVTSGGPGLVGVGLDVLPDESDVAVWTSADGLTWTRVPHDETVFGGPEAQAAYAVVAGGPGLVVVGSDASGGDVDAAVWTSADGLTWARVPHDEAVFGGPDRQQMSSAVAGGPGVVAVGIDASSGHWLLAVWTSPDGLTWSRVPYDEAAFGGGESHMPSRLVSWAGGLVLVGEASSDSDYYAAVWTSADGLTWARVPHDEAVFGGEGTQVMEAVAAGGPGLVAVGLDGPPGDFDAAVWTSADGLTWARVPHDETVFGGEMVQVMSDVVVAGGELVAVGRDDSSASVGLVVWTSPDGLTWCRVPGDEGVFGQLADLRGVSALAGGPGLVVLAGDGAVWVAAPPG